MNLWLRLAWLLMRTPFRSRLPPLGVSRLRFRVWLNDLDVNVHMNNGRYWTVFDLGRFDLMLRTGLARVAGRQGWIPIMGAGAIRFRRELRAFQTYELESRLVGWRGTRMLLEHRILTGPDREVVATRALVLAGFYSRREKGYVSAEDLFGTMGVGALVSPPLDAAAEAMMQVDAALKGEAREAPAG